MGSKSQILEIAGRYEGVGPNDPDSMDTITESRWRERPGGKKYAWCGDFATFVLMMAGCHDGGALNRVALNGSWSPGDNIARLVRWAQGYNQLRDIMDAEPGDIVIMANNTGDHICFLTELLAAQNLFRTIDGNSMGGCVSRNERCIAGCKKIRCVIDTSMLVNQHTYGPPEVENWAPLPLPPVPPLDGRNMMPFPVGWIYKETESGHINWAPTYGEAIYDPITEIGPKAVSPYGTTMSARPWTTQSLNALMAELALYTLKGISLEMGTIVDVYQNVRAAIAAARIVSPTDKITLSESYSDGYEEAV